MADSDVVLFGDFPLLLGTTVSEESARDVSRSSLYMALTLGSRTYYWSDSAFNVSVPSGLARVYNVVDSWGAFRNFLPTDGVPRDSEVEIDLDGRAICVSADDTARATILDLARDNNFSDLPFEIFQWNPLSLASTSIWYGYCLGIRRWKNYKGRLIGTLTLNTQGGVEGRTFIGDVVVKEGPAIGTTTYPNAPSDSLNKMIGVAFSDLYYTVDQGPTYPSAGPNTPIFLGYGTRALPGVVVDEQLDQLQAKVLFMQARGQAVAGASVGYTDEPLTASNFWAYIPEANTFGQLDAASITLNSDTMKLQIQSSLEPTLFVSLRPAGVGSQMPAAFTATAYKLLDDDPSNYIETTSSDYKIAFDVPALQISGMQVISVGVVADVENYSGATRDIQFGLWNDFNRAGSGMWGNTGKWQSVSPIAPTGRYRYSTLTSNRYTHLDARADANVLDSDGKDQDCKSDFSSGRFIGRDSTGADAPIQAYLQVSSTGKSGVRVYGIGVYVKCQIQMDRVRRVSRVIVSHNSYDVQGRPRRRGFGSIQSPQQILTAGVELAVAGERRFDFLYCGSGHNDVGTTYEGGSSGAVIRRAPSIAQWLIGSLGSDPINTATGTLGNFIDARVEETAGEKRIAPVWGTDTPADLDQALDDIQRHSSARFFRRAGERQCIYEEMNPHFSRWYRSTSDPVYIRGKTDILGPIDIRHIPFDQIRNRVALNYGHSFGTNRPAGSYTYYHKTSRLQFGDLPLKAEDESWIVPEDLQNFPEAAKFHARYLASRFARPRLTVTVPLALDYYDLFIGHVFQFYSDMEGAGFECPAYRCGRLDHAFIAATDSTDWADSETPKYVGASGSSYSIFMAQQRPPGMTHYVVTPAGYTVVTNSWQWWDGASWNNFANVTRSDAGDPNAFFKTAGPLSISWDDPSPWLWKKREFTVDGTTFGPGYVWRHQWSTATAQGLGNAMTRIPKVWAGRTFETIEMTPKRGRMGDYQIMEAVLQEVM